MTSLAHQNQANRQGTALADPRAYCLPRGYLQQNIARTRDDMNQAALYWTAERIAESRRYQSQVYRWAGQLLHRRGLTSMLDVGSGPGVKLAEHIAPVCSDITAIDQPSALAMAASLRVPAKLSPIDLERPPAPDRCYDLVLCADVVEHVLDPMPLFHFLQVAAGEHGLILLSTPERSRLRGREHLSCSKPDHVREWARSEFLTFLSKSGFEVIRTRLMPQDDSRAGVHRESERSFRQRHSDRSPLCCHAVLCRVTDLCVHN